MTKKETKVYCMVFTCANCKTEKYIYFIYGSPAIVPDEEKCDYCGCNNFLSPKKPQ